MEDKKYAQLNIVRRNLAELKPHPKNPRVHPHAQMAHLGRSIEKFSFTKGSIVYQKNTDYLLAGHAICETLIAKGFTEADVIEWDTDDATATQFLIADNKTSDDSEWDIEQLEGIIKELDSLPDVDLRDTGFDLKELDELFPDTIQQQEETFEIDEAMEDESEPVTKTGNIWLCGKHRVMCGDSTKAEDVERLMKGEKANMVLTDPPYGINIVKVGGGGQTQFGKVGGEKWVPANIYPVIVGDDKPFDPSHLLGMAEKLFLFGGNYYASRLPDSSGWICWDKKPEGALRNNFADCELIWTNLDMPARVYHCVWQGLIKEGEQGQKRKHPTQKPVKLIVDLLFDFSEDSDIILDLYLGSGTTLIAAAKTGRICYGMEISERYCDVICRRYHEFTGDVPTLESTGEAFPVE